MKQNTVKSLAVLAFASLLMSAGAASKVRLVYGDSWSRAGRAVKKTVASAEFKSLSKGQYVPEIISEEGGKQAEANLGSLKLPAIFVISEGGNCYYVIENVPADATAKKLLTRIRQVDAIRTEAERGGFDSADACGEFLQRMEKYVGGPRRIIAKGFYDDVFAKLKKHDPEDATGWIRHFTLGEEFDRHTKADGLELVIKANEYREKNQMTDGQSFIDNEFKKSRKHLTKEQQQGVLMAKFALYREDASRTEELNNILTKVAEFDETTFWGTAALGWLNLRKVPPLSVYWGWRKGDFKGPKMATTVKYGVDCSFPKTGRYTVSFIRDEGCADAPRIESVLLYAGKELALTLDKPQTVGNTTTFEVDIRREHRGRLTSMVVKGSAGASGESSGKISIVRRVLRARKDVAAGSGPSTAKDGTAAGYICKTAGEAALTEIRKREGGAAFLKAFLSDVEWTEQFAGSGPFDPSPWRDSPYKGDAAARLAGDADYCAKALKSLGLLVWNDKDDFISTKIGRNIATALALDHGGRFDDVKLVQVMECYREWAKDGTLHDDAWKYDVRQWREVLSFGQNAALPVEDLRWIHDFANVDGPRYYGVCWSCAYRLFNCFGASVHGWMYYAPWAHRWKTQELRYRVGGVCGALSKFGSHCAASHGIRSYTAGQPGHCAYMLWDYSKDRWGIAYAVTGHTGPHFSLGAQGFAAAEDSERYFRHPRRMDAERLRWKGDFAKSIRAVPGNFQAAEEWKLKLQAKKAPAAEWAPYADSVLAGFKANPAAGWQLYLPYLDVLGNDRAARLSAAKKGLLMMQESADETFEAPYFDDLALKPLADRFKGDEEALWELFTAVLDGQAKTKTFYRQAINWGANTLMTDGSKAKRFLQIVGANAARTGVQLDFKGMVLKASQSEDIAMFRQVYALMDKLSPNLSPKPADKSWPLERDGGKLLSVDGMLMTSSTSNWDVPTNYRNALDAKDYKDGNAFHTGKDQSPWATVVLPGASDITCITAVNAGGNGNQLRQVPIRMWLSDDGKDWKQVYASDNAQDEWTCTLPAPMKAKYIRVGRAPEAKQDFFHLHKILVYGKKLY